MVAELPFRVEEERLRCYPRVEKPGQFSARIPKDRERMPVLRCVGADLPFRLVTVAVDRDEKDALRPVLRDQVAEHVVVGVRVWTQRGPEDHHDRAMVALRPGQGKRFALQRSCGEGGRRGSDLEARRAVAEQQRE